MDFGYFLFIIMFATSPVTIEGKSYVAGDIVVNGSGMLGASDTLDKCEQAGELISGKLNEIADSAKVFYKCVGLDDIEKYAEAQKLTSPDEN